MSDVELIRGWFCEGKLIKPRAAGMNTTVDLINTLVALCGGKPARPERLRYAIQPADHYVFVIVDGLGSELLSSQCATGFLAKHAVGELESVFLSTTGAAMTSYATGTYPADHGVLGWWIYLDEHDLVGISLMFVERFSEKDLRLLGVGPESMYGTTPAILGALQRDVAIVTPFVDSVYSNYSCGGRPRIGYSTVDQAFDRALQRVKAAKQETYTQVYLPQLDGLCHQLGVADRRIGDLLKQIDRGVENFASRVGDRVRIIVCADHGHVALPPHQRIELQHDEPIMSLLKCAPCGEPTVPMFHVRAGREAEFAAMFRERFGRWFALITADEADDLRLLGPETMSALARRRLGQFMAIASEPTYLDYLYQKPKHPPFLGTHAGLTSGEMLVPLIVV